MKQTNIVFRLSKGLVSKLEEKNQQPQILQVFLSVPITGDRHRVLRMMFKE